MSVKSLAADNEPDESSGGVRPVKSAERTVRILELLSECRSPLGLREISDRLDMPRASTHALLVTLGKHGWVDNDRGQYRLGIRCLRTSAAFVDADPMVLRAERLVSELNTELRETIHLACLDGSDIVYLLTSQTPHALASVSRPGRRMSAWVTALGKAILAERDREDVEELLPGDMPALTPKTLTSHDALFDDLEATRERGYAIDDEESTMGLKCFAVAVGIDRPLTHALSCPVPLARLDDAQEKLIVERLLEVKQTLRGAG